MHPLLLGRWGWDAHPPSFTAHVLLQTSLYTNQDAIQMQIGVADRSNAKCERAASATYSRQGGWEFLDVGVG